MIRRTKIVCTIGPQTSSPERLVQLVDAGMNVARLNFSHGTHAEHRAVIRALRSLNDRYGSPIGILADLCGPKIRLGKLPRGPISVQRGETITLTSDQTDPGSARLSVSYPFLSEDVRVGQPILIADGEVVANVVEIRGRDVLCEILAGGELSSHKGVNFPQTLLRIPSLTEKDQDDLAMALDECVDFVAMSFVRTPGDMRTLRGLVEESRHPATLIAKIEKREALENFDSILEASDGIMVARGDLGVETDLARVPLVQKDLIARAREKARPVITATQMLESMIQHPMPTRAEVADVANAILDGTDAVMLSGETAVGRYPIEAVRMMANVVAAAEGAADERTRLRRNADRTRLNVSESIAQSSAQMSRDLEAAAVVVCTDSGTTARLVSRFRPSAPIVAGTPRPVVARQLTLSWGVIPVLLETLHSTDHMISETSAAARRTGVVRSGDQIVITAGIPFGKAGGTNLLLVQTLS